MDPKGWRRLIFVLLALGLGSLLLFLGKLSGAEWVEFTQWLGSGYLASDAVEKTTTAWQGRRTLSPPKPVAPPAAVTGSPPDQAGEA